MKNKELTNGKANASFSRAALLAEPSLIAVACYLARVAAEEDLKSVALDAQKSYNVGQHKGGPS